MEQGARLVAIAPPHVGAGRTSKAVGSRLGLDPADCASLTPVAARRLADELYAAAQVAETWDAAMLPILDQYIAALSEHVSPAQKLGVDDEAVRLTKLDANS